jgi:xanthine dehydrogenase accessory factor
MRDVLPEIVEWLDRGDRIALATVVEVVRSAPRPPGAKMAVNERGEVAGAVSGGCVEGAVLESAQQVLSSGEPRMQRFGIADEGAWDVGLPCGGEIGVFVEALGDSSTETFMRVAAEEGRAALITVVSGPDRLGAKLLVRTDADREGTLGGPSLDATATTIGQELLWGERSDLRQHAAYGLFCDVVAPQPRLLVFGAVDYASALCRLARGCGWRPYVIDPRRAFATSERFPDADGVIAAWPEEGVARVGGIDAATAIAILTHDPKLDDAALSVALSSDACYIGAMGSRRAQAKRRERLLEAGFTEEAQTPISAPIGLDLGAVSTEETALSIMAEIVAARHGHSGGRLADAQGRIHAVGR